MLRPALPSSFLVAFALSCIVAWTAACPGTMRAGQRLLGGATTTTAGGDALPPTGLDDAVPAQSLAVIEEDRTIDVPLPEGAGGTAAHLGARLVRPESGRGPGILIVPGGGDVSRDGTRRGDGVSVYAHEVDVSHEWAAAFARRGAVVLAWDKRTCGPNDDAQCVRNPQADIDANGPVAMARDVDAACAVMKKEPSFDGRIILLAHSQASQVALSSTCAQQAAAIVLLSPIPRAVDRVLVDALRDRQASAEAALAQARDPLERATLQTRIGELKNLAASKEAGFSSMKSGSFARDARIDGATLAFWLGWIDATTRTVELMRPLQGHIVVVSGSRDLQYAARDRALAKALPAARVVEVDGDHHLLSDGVLTTATVDAVGSALDAILPPPTS